MIQPQQEMVTLSIDGREVTVEKGTTIIEAAARLGIDVPHYCYDRDLSIVASCRLCLVEIENVPKLQPSCSTPASAGQVVYTRSEKVLDARRMQMEFLLVQHPLDCPVCDQGGECKLQDYSMKHGTEDTRFRFVRRIFPKPDIGPFIDLERNRCILCTRCVRFMDEVAGNAEFAVVERGYRSHISTFQNRPLQNEFAGNTIDLCPVGALTSKITRFRTRVWELKSKPSVCSLCSVGCNVFLQHRNRTHEILRIVPRLNDEVNHRWICDIGRFGFDQFNSHERATKPMIKNGQGQQVETGWGSAIRATIEHLKNVKTNQGPHAIAGIIGPRQSNETLFLFQQFFREVIQTNNIDHRTEHVLYSNDDGYITSLAHRAVNDPFREIKRCSTIVLIGTDLPNELPILHLQAREQARKGKRIVRIHSRPTRFDKDCSRLWDYAPGEECEFIAGLLWAVLKKKNTQPSDEIKSILQAAAKHSKSEKTTVGSDQLDQIADALLEEDQTTLLIGESVYASTNGSVNVRLLAELAEYLKTEPGSPLLPLSLLLPYSNSRGAYDMGCLPHREAGYAEVKTPGRNTTQILEGCVDGSIQALVVFNSNLIEEYPDRDLVERALNEVPCLVVGDAFRYETAAFADVFLSLSMYTEEDGTFTNLAGRVQRAEKAVNQLEGTLSGFQTLLALGEGWGAGWRQVSLEKINAMMVKAVPHYEGLSWEALKQTGKNTKEVDFTRFQSSSRTHASCQVRSEKPSDENYPFRLVRGRYLFDTLGEKRFAPALVKRSDQCAAEIHPDDAKRLNLRQDRNITLRGDLGSLEVPFKVSEQTKVGCVTLLGHYAGLALNGVVAEDRPRVTIQQ